MLVASTSVGGFNYNLPPPAFGERRQCCLACRRVTVCAVVVLPVREPLSGAASVFVI